MNDKLRKKINTIKKGKHFHGSLFFASGIMSFIACCLFFVSNTTSAQGDLLQQAFETANSQELIIDLGNTKEAVGNEVLREGKNINISLSKSCYVAGGSERPVEPLVCEEDMGGVRHPERIFADKCRIGSQREKPSDSALENKCITLWGERSNWGTTTRPPLIVRIAKFLLRITIVLSVTMVLYNGVYYIVEASKWGDVKEASNNLIYVVVGVLLALFSLAIINLISSISISSLF